MTCHISSRFNIPHITSPTHQNFVILSTKSFLLGHKQERIDIHTQITEATVDLVITSFHSMKSLAHPTLCVLTGMPETGKSTTSDILRSKLGTDWNILHADDYINETNSKYGDGKKQWPQLRPYRPILIGASVSPILCHGKNVLLEGNLKDETEIRNLLNSIKKTFQNHFEFKVILLRGDFNMILKRYVSDSGRVEPQYGGANREDNCRLYLLDVRTEENIADFIVDLNGRTKDEIADEVLSHIV